MPTILSTKKLDKHQEQLMLNANISFVSYDAIRISFYKELLFPQKVENAIVTSKNTWQAIKDKISIKNAFVVGIKTTQLLQESGIEIIESTDYGKDLAQKICSTHSAKEFHFFCGKQRRDELPTQLKINNISFTETQVYDTLENHREFSQEFDGILFFSPSGVKSFCAVNDIKSATAFCIGTTTAKEAEKYTKNIIIANQPTIENVIVQVVKTYKND
ncbi:uroporphyrinogen-III synthase [Mesonia sp. MT50]|uniref:Uroporphyrinogen-III synthase n=1 Tax=Mesonia profundi TaxID=3070998 RepID=A0ABU0ZYS7_9FLAO|nr:uroporphyrinogen-III synthase [Mesonia profundi]MDQ7916623.1 uroporphyrinogen-III synthase [Mesonia profundi]